MKLLLCNPAPEAASADLFKYQAIMETIIVIRFLYDDIIPYNSGYFKRKILKVWHSLGWHHKDFPCPAEHIDQPLP